MLLKTRREFTLCFLLFVPLGMAGYCAEVKSADSPAAQTTKVKTTKSNSRAAENQGGQPAPQNPGGGLSSTEQLSRLLVDGRRAFRDGELITAQSFFRDALKLDQDNPEARRFLKEIETKSSGALFSPDGLSAQIPVGAAGSDDKVDVLGTVEAVKANAAPTPVTQSLSANDQKVSVNNTVSMSMTAANSVSRPVSIAVSLDGSTAQMVEPAKAEAAPKAEVAKADAPSGIETLERLARNLRSEEASAKDLLSETSLAVDKEKEAREAAAKERAEAEKKATEKVAAEKAAAEKAEAEELARVKAEAERVEREKVEKELAARKAEEERKAAEAAKKAEEERLAAEAAKRAEEERKAAEAAKKAEEERIAAEKKAEEDRKAAEAAKKAEEERKAEEARHLAEAEKEAREAAEKAEKEKQIAAAVEEKKLFNKAVSETNDGIKLYNAGNYEEARAKFESALVTQPDYSEARSYLQRTDRKLAPETKPAESAAPVLNLDQLKDDLKQVAQASSSAANGNDAAATTTASSGNSENENPIVQADKLLTEAQAQLADGKRAEALATARKALELDPKNTNATELVADLSSDSALPALGESADAGATAQADVDAATDTVSDATSLDVAAPSVTLPTIKGPDGVSSLLSEGRSKFESGQLRESKTAFEAVLERDPGNAEAKRYLDKIGVARAGEGLPSLSGGMATAQTAQDAESAFQQGLVAYQAGRLDVAVQHWNFSLTLNPNHPRAVQYLEQTRGEYEAWVQQHQYNAIELQKEVSSTNKLETPVTYDSSGPKTLVEFLQAMSIVTDINFYVADGVDPDLRIVAKFDQTVLSDALDIVLLPVGLKWHRTDDVVSVTTDLHNKFYNLTPDQVARLKPLLENNTLQRFLYGPEGQPPMRNVELLLDDRENMLIVTDSFENLNKIEAFLKDLQVDAPQQLVFKNWKIRATEGNRIKALVEAIVKVNSDAAWDLDRRVIVEGDDLVVKDTAENIAKIEQLLLDKNFLSKLEDQTLSVQSYSLIPREPIGPENVEQARDMAQSIVTVVKTILYSQSGEESAASQGRRFWYDPNTLQLTITDYPANLGIVSDYLKSLPTLSSSEQKSDIIWLKHQTAPEMQGLLEQVLGLRGSFGTGGARAGNAITKTLRTEGELTFGDLHIRLREVTGTDTGTGGSSQNDKSCTLIVRTATTSQDVTLREFDTEFVDEYEITADDIRPSGYNDGEGSVRLRIAVSTAAVAGVGGFGGVGMMPGMGMGGMGMGMMPGMAMPGMGGLGGAVSGMLAEEVNIVIESVPNMNALLIRYTNPADLDEVKEWLRELDRPVMQVSIETKLVEVNETRAKEFMPEFNWANIGHGSPDFSNSTNFFDFAKNDFVGELGRSPFDPFPEDSFNSGLLKGTSVFNIITGGPSPISFTLRALESEGVVNLTNGPTVTVENGQSAEFTIGRDFGLQTIRTGDNQQNVSIPRLEQVNMTVEPQITQDGEIRLEITNLQLNDFGNQIGNIFPITISEDDNQNLDDNIPVGPIVGNVPYEVRRRSLTTVARVKNHGTIVLGGWMGERSRTNDSGVPVLRNLPYVGKLLFGRTSDKIDRTNLLIFLTCHLIDP